MSTETTLQRAVAAPPFNGNQSRFAGAIGTSQQNIHNWLTKGRALPAEFVLKAEEATGISRHDWRPDIYPASHNEARLVCGTCEERVDDHVVNACTAIDCPHRERSAA